MNGLEHLRTAMEMHMSFVDPVYQVAKRYSGNAHYTQLLAHRLKHFCDLHQRPLSELTLCELESIAKAADEEFNFMMGAKHGNP